MPGLFLFRLLAIPFALLALPIVIIVALVRAIRDNRRQRVEARELAEWRKARDRSAADECAGRN